MAFMPPIITVMLKAAEAASRSLLRDFGEVENLQISVKGPSDFVTAADKRAEKILCESLTKTRPGWGFLMEEGGEINAAPGKGRFIIDPLDGTHNFLHGLPHWCTTMAAEENGEIIAALTHDPIRNETFWAAKGTGAFMNNRKIRASGRKDLSTSLISTPMPRKGRGDLEVFTRDITRMSALAGDLRAFHSCALDMAYIAAGRMEAMWCRQISPWDVAAGALLIREAGGMVSEVNGGSNAIYGGSILATNSALYQDVKSLLNP